MKALHLAALLLSLSAAHSLAQGPLTPPGAPAPTMKTLDQIEARTPIAASPAVPVAGPHLIITTPGSYYLTGNITVASGDAIRILSDDVTVNLNGFKISSTLTGTSSGSGIALPGNFSRLTVRDGSIVGGTTVAADGTVVGAGFQRGIFANNAIKQAVVQNVHVTGVSNEGIFLDDQGVVQNCTVRNCGSQGIVAEIVTNCSVDNCAQTGINAQEVSNSSGASILANGITSGGNVFNCFASSTSSTGLSCSGNVSNSTGTSGSSASNTFGIGASGTVSYCRGRRDGGVAISANIAIGCTVIGTGTVSAVQKFLGTP